MYGGILAIIIGVIFYWSAAEDYLRFGVSGAVLYFLSGLASRNSRTMSQRQVQQKPPRQIARITKKLQMHSKQKTTLGIGSCCLFFVLIAIGVAWLAFTVSEKAAEEFFEENNDEVTFEGENYGLGPYAEFACLKKTVSPEKAIVKRNLPAIFSAHQMLNATSLPKRFMVRWKTWQTATLKGRVVQAQRKAKKKAQP